MKSIAPKLFAVMIALGASSAVCASVNLHGEAGAEFHQSVRQLWRRGTGYDVQYPVGSQRQ